jgi:hypothetical protein
LSRRRDHREELLVTATCVVTTEHILHGAAGTRTWLGACWIIEYDHPSTPGPRTILTGARPNLQSFRFAPKDAHSLTSH